jgi:CDP-glycerol glycerophosphotransferase
MSLRTRFRKLPILYPALSAVRMKAGALYMRLCHAIFGVDRSTALFSSYNGRGYSDNPQPVSEALHALRPDLKIVWEFQRGCIPDDLPDYIRPIPAHSLKAVRAFATTGVIVCNNNRAHYMLKFPGQIYVQTWHGDRGFKKVLLDLHPDDDVPDGAQMDLAVSGSRFGSQVYRSSMGYDGEILEVGCPRNDALVCHTPADVAAARSALDIPPETRVLLYAPTFRQAERDRVQHAPLDLDAVRRHLEAVTGQRWLGLTRAHGHARAIEANGQRDVSQWPSINELLLVTDLLITDYSSVGGDFMLLNRPVIYFQPDRDAYHRERSLYFDPDASPLKVAHSEAELMELLSHPFDAEENCREVLDFFGTRETGRAAQAVAERIVVLMNS